MTKVAREAAARAAAVQILEHRGYSVRDISSGSGVPKLSRLEIADNANELTCAVKVTAMDHGRISFTRNDDGTYKVLSDCDRVVYVRFVDARSPQVLVSMYDSATLIRAFDECFASLQATGQENLPMWLSPRHEHGDRFVGSGFESEALWEELWSPGFFPRIAADSTPPLLTDDASVESTGIMEQIKAMLSVHMGVRPDQLEIDVRVKV